MNFHLISYNEESAKLENDVDDDDQVIVSVSVVLALP